MKRILVPVDFSDVSMDALKVAAYLAVQVRANLHIVHVNEMLTYALQMSEYASAASAIDIEEYDRGANDRLQTIKSDLENDFAFSNLSIETTINAGLMIPAVKEIATDENSDLIVIGTTGAHGWKEVWTGSNTEHIIRHSTCPILVVPKGIKELDIKKILVPSTFQPDQLAVFKVVKAWQDLFHFDVVTLYMNDPLNTSNHESVEIEKDRLAEKAGLKDVFLHCRDRVLYEEDTIQAYADEIKADLIVMGTHQRHGLSHLLFGSITEDTANHTHLPVLAVPISKRS